MYGKTVTIELDHSDFDLTELMEVFKGLTIASGFEMNSWNNVIKDLSAEIHDNEREDLKEKLNEWKMDENDEDDEDEFKHEDLRHSTPNDRLDEWKARNGFGSWTADSEGYESNIDAEEEMKKYAMDIIGQNGNEGTHYTYEWDDNIKGYDYESNTILNSINDSITLIKDRMIDIDLKMDNIDEQLGILNADVANIELNIEHPLKRTLLNAKEVYDKSVIETGRQLFKKQKEAMDKYNAFNDVVDMDNGEVSATNEVSNNGGFDGKALFTPYKKKPNQKVTEKVIGKWQTDNKTKEVVKLDKTKVRKGKIKDLKK
jgi:hypothetical protein